LLSSLSRPQIFLTIQSSGGTAAVGSAVVADIVTRAERGKYIGYASMGVTLGPALGPIIGGLLSQFLGWRSIFWFLTIFVGSMMFIMLLSFPETSRCVVGNGSVPSQKWNASLMDIIRRRRRQRKGDIPLQTNTITCRKRRLNPLEAVQIAFQKEAGTILLFGALLYAGFISVLSTLLCS
jgi:MFS family permease